MDDQLPEARKKEPRKKKSLKRIRAIFGIGSRPDVHTPAESPESSPDWLDIRARATEEAAKPAGSRKRDEEKSPRPPTSSAPDLHAKRSVPDLRKTHHVAARTPGSSGSHVLRTKQSAPNLGSRRPSEAVPPLPPLPRPPPNSSHHQRSQAVTNIPKIPASPDLRQVNSAGSNRRVKAGNPPPVPRKDPPPGWF